MGKNRPKSNVDNERPKKIKKRKTKINLVFDEAKRKDFLSGFHKRKLQRKKQAQDEFEEKLKEERKRIKLESKDAYKKLVVSRRPIPELEDLLTNEYENEDVTVKVVELSTNDFAEKNNWIGQNKPQYEEEDDSKSEAESSEDEIPGMELKRKPKKVEVEEMQQEEPTKSFKSKKDINKMIKKAATKKVQKSKTFQTKNKMEQLKNKKKSMQMKSQRKKFASKKGKQRHRGSKGKQAAH